VARPPDATWVQGGPPTPPAGTWAASPHAPAPVHPPALAHPPYAVVPGYAVPVGVPVVAPPKSKAAAALLCLFLGSLGIHRFYTGQQGLGLALLLTTLILGPLTCGLWYAVTLVWVLVDLVCILTGAVSDEWGRPLV